MLLYPQLPLTIARNTADKLLSKSTESLLQLNTVSHPLAVYNPTGGNRVSESYLQEINLSMRNNAYQFGYPTPNNDLKMHSFDTNAGRILYEMLDISPSEASNAGIWAFMACIMWPDIVRWRFPGHTEGTSRERFVGGRRNTFGRMWWRTYILRDIDNKYPYELLELLGEDDLVQITERPGLAGSPLLAREICKTFIRTMADHSNAPQSRILLRDAVKRLRRLLPMVSFDALDDQILRDLIQEIFQHSVKSLRAS